LLTVFGVSSLSTRTADDFISSLYNHNHHLPSSPKTIAKQHNQAGSPSSSTIDVHATALLRNGCSEKKTPAEQHLYWGI
jgi:SOS-response transcriptional repressor LexA